VVQQLHSSEPARACQSRSAVCAVLAQDVEIGVGWGEVVLARRPQDGGDVLEVGQPDTDRRGDDCGWLFRWPAGWKDDGEDAPGSEQRAPSRPGTAAVGAGHSDRPCLVAGVG
jgi:hypothetical protein